MSILDFFTVKRQKSVKSDRINSFSKGYSVISRCKSLIYSFFCVSAKYTNTFSGRKRQVSCESLMKSILKRKGWKHAEVYQNRRKPDSILQQSEKETHSQRRIPSRGGDAHVRCDGSADCQRERGRGNRISRQNICLEQLQRRLVWLV